MISIHTLTLRVTAAYNGFVAIREISIHTLTLRVTSRELGVFAKLDISIHTLTLRVTPFSMPNTPVPFYFNPHPHTEGD